LLNFHHVATMRRTLSYRVLLAFASAAALGACGGATEPAGDQPSEFISMRRAWLPGERAATIAQIQATGGLSQASPFVSQVYADTDSVTVIAANPDFSARSVNGSSLLLMEPTFAVSWNIAGMEYLEVNINPVPADTVHWVGIFWSNPAEPAWKGFILAASTGSTVARVDINTTAFDNSAGKTGAGGAEIRPSTSTYWQGNGPIAGANNDFQVSAASYGAATTITSGPFTGGTMQSGSMQGRAQKVTMARLQGATAPSPLTVDYDFRSVAIGATRIVCVFNTPCTTNVPNFMTAWRASMAPAVAPPRR
jgi:hypothetical protein